MRSLMRSPWAWGKLLLMLSAFALIARCTGLPAFAQVPAPRGSDEIADAQADQVEAVLHTDILPLFEENPGLIYGVETVVTFEDRDYPAIHYVVVTLVRAVVTPHGRLTIEEVRTFRAMPGLAPRLLTVNSRRPWPHE